MSGIFVKRIYNDPAVDEPMCVRAADAGSPHLLRIIIAYVVLCNIL
jgi:hypothetical protein